MRNLIIDRIKNQWEQRCNRELVVSLGGHRTYLGNSQWSDWLVRFNNEDLTISDSVWGDAIECILNEVSDERLLELYDTQLAEIVQ